MLGAKGICDAAQHAQDCEAGGQGQRRRAGAIALGAPGAAARPAQGPPQPFLFTNPVLGPGQDPSVVTAGGWYYFTQTSPDATYITIRRARSVKSLAAAPKTVVWRGGEAGSV